MAKTINSKKFPRLNPKTHLVTSPATPKYNCIGWAAEEDYRWWWPQMAAAGHYWPPNAPDSLSIASFISVFGDLGYSECTNGDLEDGYQKVVLFVKQGVPTHMARQLSDGNWTSKLGEQEDIQHTKPIDVTGPEYGTVSTFLKRAVRTSSA